jgi:DNA-binding transcriptional ArsR family regulator
MARLKEAGLVESNKRGIWVYYRLRADLAPATRRILAQLMG